MEKVEKVINAMRNMEKTTGRPVLHPVVFMLVTVAYLISMLSVPVDSLSMLLWFGMYPILMSAAIGQDFNRIFVRSLVVLPFAAFIGVFNPLYQTEIVFYVGDVGIRQGWVTFVSIILRALLSAQALLVLMGRVGFISLCRGLAGIGFPSVLTTQLMMVYRYLTVLLQESLDMSRARKARGYGKKHMDLRMWGVLCGQLFLRTVNRSQNIHRAMLARGFTGIMPRYLLDNRRLSLKDFAVLFLWIAIFIAMRIFNFSSVFLSFV